MTSAPAPIESRRIRSESLRSVWPGSSASSPTRLNSCSRIGIDAHTACVGLFDDWRHCPRCGTEVEPRRRSCRVRGVRLRRLREPGAGVLRPLRGRRRPRPAHPPAVGAVRRHVGPPGRLPRGGRAPTRRPAARAARGDRPGGRAVRVVRCLPRSVRRGAGNADGAQPRLAVSGRRRHATRRRRRHRAQVVHARRATAARAKSRWRSRSSAGWRNARRRLRRARVRARSRPSAARRSRPRRGHRP